MKNINTDTIDFVLPWVDPSDTQWQKERDKYDTRFNVEDRGNPTRFRDTKTLKYVLRSIEAHCPWYNKIYLITIGHYPDWIDITHPKIELVTHEDLFVDKSALPVFNSNAIEMNLVNIRGLSEQFVYLNDDMIIWDCLEKTRFFKEGLPVDFFYHGWFPRNSLIKKLITKDLWIDALNNNLALINKSFKKPSLNSNCYYHDSYALKYKMSNFLYLNVYKKVFWFAHWHHPQPYRKKTLYDVFEHYEEEMIETSHHKFRSAKDLTPYLYRYWHLMKGEFVPFDHKDGYMANLKSLKGLLKDVAKLKQDKTIKFVCFNDQMHGISDQEFTEVVVFLEKYLEERFPKKADFEL